MARLVVELTNRCNLACAHCFSGRHGGKDDLPFDALEAVLADASAFGFDHLSFTGGDPTVYPRFADAVRRTADAGFAFSMVTNGVNFDRSHRAILPYGDALRQVTFSLEGATEATHERIRGRGSFRAVLRAMSLALALDIPFSNNLVVARHNRHELAAAVELAAQLGSRGLRFGHLMPSPDTTARGYDLSPDERLDVEAEIRDLAAVAPIRVAMAPGYATDELFPCAPLQRDEANLDCRGNLSLCCHLSSHGGDVGTDDIAGNVLELGFAEAFRRLEAERDRFRADKLRRQRAGALTRDDRSPCWYCSKSYRKVDWLRRVDGHPWGELLPR